MLPPMAQKINIQKYVAEVKRNLNIEASDEIIEKDLWLTLLLAELQKEDLGKELIFKGGTLLARNYLKYHRFSEDLDFVHKKANELRTLKRNTREKEIKKIVDILIPKLKEIADRLELTFSTDRSNTKFCTILHGRTVYILRMYYAENNYIKIEINFVEKMIHQPKEITIKAITDFFDAKELMFTLGLQIENFKVLSYPLEEIIIEKHRAILTRNELKERDLFDLFLIKDADKVDIKHVVEKIKNASLIKRNLQKTITEKLALLMQDVFFKSDENIDDIAIIKYSPQEFSEFKQKLKPVLIEICKEFLKKS